MPANQRHIVQTRTLKMSDISNWHADEKDLQS